MPGEQRIASHRLNAEDRGAIFKETASGATDTRLPYWSVLLLAGGIASLGLALNSVAVVIGAMLVAPLLAPVLGLALALAVGDSRLSVRTFIVLFVSTVAVIAVAAVLTVLLPFHTLTAQISARTQPTLLDLGIAIFSGLVGAVVTVSRGTRLAAAVPGVAVSVALVPPLAVAGYGIGTGWNGAIIRGSLLLYGANLAGIVISAMAVFLIAGMHHPDVMAVATAWHRDDESVGLWKWLERVPGLRSLGILGAPWARVALVLCFVALVAVPLNASLRQIASEARVQRAVEIASRQFTKPGRSFVVSRQVAIGNNTAKVTLNVATTSWFADSARAIFERRASRLAREPITLVLDQLPASTGDIKNFATLIATRAVTQAAVPTSDADTLANVVSTQSGIDVALGKVALPDSVTMLGYDFEISDTITTGGTRLHVAYLASDPLAPQATQVIVRQIRSELSTPSLVVIPIVVRTGPTPIDGTSAFDADSVASLLARYSKLAASVLAGPHVSRAELDSIVVRIRKSVKDSSRVSITHTSRSGVFVILQRRSEGQHAQQAPSATQLDSTGKYFKKP